jgi:hypothetical protein
MEIVLVLSVKDLESLGTVRALPRLSAAVDGELIWVRGIRQAEFSELRFRQIPAIYTYMVDEDDYLFGLAEITPVGKLKDLPWTSMIEFLSVDLPVSGLPCKLTEKINIKITPSDVLEKGSALLTDLHIWKLYIETAALIRLRKLKFAMREDNKVLIIGTPLPPIPGREFYLKNDIMLPSGYNFEFNIVWDMIPEILNPDKNSIILIDTQSNCHIIAESNFVDASRSSLRLTKEAKHE